MKYKTNLEKTRKHIFHVSAERPSSGRIFPKLGPIGTPDAVNTVKFRNNRWMGFLLLRGSKKHVSVEKRRRPEHCIALSCMHVTASIRAAACVLFRRMTSQVSGRFHAALLRSRPVAKHIPFVLCRTVLRTTARTLPHAAALLGITSAYSTIHTTPNALCGAESPISGRKSNPSEANYLQRSYRYILPLRKATQYRPNSLYSMQTRLRRFLPKCMGAVPCAL